MQCLNSIDKQSGLLVDIYMLFGMLINYQTCGLAALRTLADLREEADPYMELKDVEGKHIWGYILELAGICTKLYTPNIDNIRKSFELPTMTGDSDQLYRKNILNTKRNISK